jgi:hypothetical protein
MQEYIEETIEQLIMPDPNCKLACTNCAREDWHYLILRRKRGLIEGLCKQIDGSGCYPNLPRTLCDYDDPDKIPCPQLAQFEACDSSGNKLFQACADHLGILYPIGQQGIIVTDMDGQ